MIRLKYQLFWQIEDKELIQSIYPHLHLRTRAHHVYVLVPIARAPKRSIRTNGENCARTHTSR